MPAEGPEHKEGKPVDVSRRQIKKRRPFITKGSYYAMGWITVAGIASWLGYLREAIYLYAAGGVLFILFCGPAVTLILHKLNDAMVKHHESVPAMHGHWLAHYCPACEVLYP